MLGHAAGDYVGTTFETTADTLAIGCVLALGRHALWRRPSYRWAVDTPWFAPLLLIVALVIGLRLRPGLLFGMTLGSIAIMLVIDRAVRHADDSFGRILNSPILVHVGTLSYSIYLWQQLFLNRTSTSQVAMFPLNIVLVLTMAVASYYLVERPFLRWRPRLEARWFGPGAPISRQRLEQATGL
jgi:peptidoglycan/LPS O-acetylase OafA/YrhL